MLSRFIIAACTGITSERKIMSSSTAESTTTIPMKSGSLLAEHVGEIDRARGEPADQDRHARSVLERRQHVVTQAVDEVGRRLRLRGRGGIDLDDGDGARGRDPRLRDRDDSWVGRPRLRSAGSAAARSRLGSSATSSSGPLKPGPKPCASRSNALRELDVGRVVTGVARVEPQREHGEQQRDHHRQRAIANGHGRACTISLHCRHAEWRRGS